MGYSSLKGARPSTRRTSRKRTGLRSAMKVKYQAPTARNQKRQIATNASRISRLEKFDRRHQIYTDYRLESHFEPAWNIWSPFHLSEPVNWLPCLRQDPNIQRGSHTFCKRMVMNMRVDLGTITDESVVFSIFVVRPRWSNPNLIFPPVPNNDFIEQAPGMNVRLNSAKYKVVASKYITLTVPAFGQSLADPANPPGNPFSTYRKWQWSIPLNMPLTVSSPQGLTPSNSWMAKTMADLPYYHRYYLMAYCSHTGVAPTGEPTVYYDIQFTCVNSD